MEDNIEKKTRKKKKKTDSPPPRSSPPPSLRPFTIPKTGNKGKYKPKLKNQNYIN